jgi:hypothetical protein
MELCLHFSICLHGIVITYLSIGTNLPLHNIEPPFTMLFLSLGHFSQFNNASIQISNTLIYLIKTH